MDVRKAFNLRLTLFALLALTCLVPGCRDDEDNDPAVVDAGPDPDPGPGPDPDPGPGPDLGPDLGPGWWKQESGMNYGFITHVSFSDALHGWAAGLYDLSVNNYTFLRTVNGGYTWTPLPMPPGNGSVNQMEFQDEFHGWVVQGGVAYMTTNGGVSWQVVPNSYAIKFVDSQTGWIVSDVPGPATYALQKTTDGGNTWSTMHLIFDDIRVNDLDAVGDSAWVVGEVRGESPWEPVVGSYVVATSDGGATWSEQQVGTSKGLSAVDFADEMNGWIVGDRVYRTSNGGATWAAQSPALSIYRDVCFVNATTGWVVGADGVILKTRSGGEGPAPGPSPGPHGWSLQDADTNVAVTRVTAVDSDHAWIKRADGPILRTQDGGSTWTSLESPANAHKIQFFDTSNGWLCGNEQLYSTSDGGATWTVRRTDESGPPGVPPLWDFSFISATSGWVVHSGGPLVKTTDGGVTWTELPELPGNQPHLKFFDEQTGWLTSRSGSGPRIFKTSNGGLTWV